MSDDKPEASNVIPLFPEKRQKPQTADRPSKAARHQHSSLEVLIISVASVRRVNRSEVEADLCAAMGVDRWEDAPPAEAHQWLNNALITKN